MRGSRFTKYLRTGVSRLLVLVLLASAVLLGSAAQAMAGTNTNYSGVNPDVSSAARKKFTTLRGKGKDKVTIMIYMIGTDLESQSGMATSDLNEMLYSGLDNSKVNLFVQTGGCRRWRNNVMTAGKVQRWQMTGRGFELLETQKSQAMTSGSVLTDFIQFCEKEAPADRYMLIFWDHGGGSVSGYGYDELYPNDSMDIGEIANALRYADVKFDLIGFDACLMATLETAIAIEPYADYMIASEEPEPGTGWYYVDWLKLLDENSSTNTLRLGRQIADDFVTASAKVAPRSQTTLSLIDLAELKGTVLEELGDFGVELSARLQSADYRSVASARNGTREFAQSQRLDQADLVDFCTRLGTPEAMELAEAIQGAVKYNRVSGITDAYGLSVYFPKSSLRSINSMLRLYENIGMDENWGESVRAYATLESSGQIAASSGQAYGSGSGSLIDILLGGGYDTGSSSGQSTSSGYDSLYGGGSSYGSYSEMSVEDIYNMLTGGASWYTESSSGSTGSTSSYGGSSYGSSYGGAASAYDALYGQLADGYTTTGGTSYGGMDIASLLGGYGADAYGSYGSYGTYTDSGSDSGSVLGSLLGLAAEMLFRNAPVGADKLTLSEKDGQQVLVLAEDTWEQITDVELNVFVDDGGGFLDLGLDNVAEYNEDGDLIDDWDGTWLTIQGQPAAVYPISDEDDDEDGLYITRKFIPALLNGERVNLIVEFNEETGEDLVLGAQSVTPTGVVGKGYTEMNGGDVITLVCDYYTYDGVFSAQYTLGSPVIVPEDGRLSVANMKIAGGEDDRMLYTYRLTDLYQAHYWLPVTEG